ncbi:high affinity copper uptake protein 1-like [Teleopsis dalmanni]|uniref:high affinity copper uptake protein 1-like n=1 Tax=Teleopsis dalmanni TaxID=139649 RepID=UPI0018CDC4B9|nr:high affinity copper uptake protein 1-like [Teleopsis dalmanni]
MDMGSGSNSTTVVKKCPMIMVFHGGHCERILWTTWVASTVSEFAWSCVAWFAICFLYEALKFLREYLIIKTARREQERMAAEHSGDSSTPLAEINNKTYFERILSSTHILQTALNGIQVIVSYLIMLVFMNFNYWLCLSCILGLSIGYFCFGWLRLGSNNNCCN